MHQSNLFDLFVHCESLSTHEKNSFIASLKLSEPENAAALEKLLIAESDFTQQFFASIHQYSEQLANKGSSVGEVYGAYRLKEQIGTGGMSQVFLADRIDGLIEQQVAIKFLHPALYKMNSAQLILNEAQALASLNHPNIATIFDVVKTDDNLVYLVMEYVKGSTLSDYLKHHSLQFDQKLELFVSIASAVEEAHNRCIIHGDIKPSNILMDDKGTPKLIDFGVMKIVSESPTQSNTWVNRYLRAMTINYAAPEQLRGQGANIQSDVYGLGCLLYFILTGSAPYAHIGGELEEKVQAVICTPTPELQLATSVRFKQDIQLIANKAMCKTVNQRYRNVGEMVSDVELYLHNLPLKEIKSLSYKLKKSWFRNRLSFVFSFVLFVTVFIFSGYTWLTNKKLQESNELLEATIISQIDTVKDSLSVSSTMALPTSQSLPSSTYIKLMLKKIYYEAIAREDISPAHDIVQELQRYLEQEHIRDIALTHTLAVLGQITSQAHQHTESSLRRQSELLAEYLKVAPDEASSIIDVLMLSTYKCIELQADEDPSMHQELGLLHRQLYAKVVALTDSQPLSPEYEIKRLLVKNHIELPFSEEVSNFERAFELLELANGNMDKISSSLYLYAVEVTIDHFGIFSTGKLADKTGDITRFIKTFLDSRTAYMDHWRARSVYASLSRYQVVYDISNYVFYPLDSITNSMEADIAKSNSHFLARQGQFELAFVELEKSIAFYQTTQDEKSKKVNELRKELEQLAFGVSTDYLPILNDEIDHSMFPPILYAGIKATFCFNLALSRLPSTYQSACLDLFENHELNGELVFTDNAISLAALMWYGVAKNSQDGQRFYFQLKENLAKLSPSAKLDNYNALLVYAIALGKKQDSQRYLAQFGEVIRQYAGDMYVVKRDWHRLFELQLTPQTPEMLSASIKDVASRACRFPTENNLRNYLLRVGLSFGLSDLCN